MALNILPIFFSISMPCSFLGLSKNLWLKKGQNTAQWMKRLTKQIHPERQRDVHATE
jgi:hypothetical protein